MNLFGPLPTTVLSGGVTDLSSSISGFRPAAASHDAGHTPPMKKIFDKVEILFRSLMPLSRP